MAINATKQDEELQKQDKRKTVKRLFAYLMDYKGRILLVLLTLVVTVGISLVNPLLIEKAVDVYLPKKDQAGLMRLGVFTLAINLVFVMVLKIRMYTMSYVSNHILVTIRQDLYEHIQTLSFPFFDGRPTGKIIARIIGDVNSLKRVLQNAVTTLIPGIFTILGVAVIMMVKDITLGLLCLAVLPVMLAGCILIFRLQMPFWQQFRKKASNLNAYVHEDVSGMSVVHSFAAEEETKENFEELVKEHKQVFNQAVIRSDLFDFVINACWGVSCVCLYWGGTKLIGMERVSLGTLVSFGVYIGMFWEPVMNIASFYNQLVTNLSSAERIFEVLDTPAEISDKPDAVELPEITGAVTFDHVSFTYDVGTPEETKVLEDVSFFVKPGERIALVGPTGAGKTTIISLLSRFYDIGAGKVLVDGYDVRDVTLKSLRKQMGVMTQENFIFSGTIADNIRYGKADATMEEIVEAAKAVNAHEFIMQLENGYDTVMKERGAGLSVGQRQLIAFARTMVSKPKILILDEATSSIDTKNELLVQRGIEGLLKGRTSFVIAHRLSTIQNADRIFVVDEGGIAESGSPRELLAKRGQYYRLYMAQFEEIA
ncbi:ATP-binding cassette, subfamily B [Lachnospiraceae bacterium XBB1006]|nr:ATP-binding cassette, subfamily B [Lachnospiraceae bacterium XBB1006]